ncbi:MAG: class I SAM-dependent methyltransferase [Phycisphaerae bacterium]|nr:class I SAM-dependent methyltransferase [Phycisphaerae bacterium]
MPNDPPFWEDADTVKWFADLEPDDKLLALLSEHYQDRPIRVLDLGCAGGRNSEALVRRGCDVCAMDLSTAMVRHTRQRLSGLSSVAKTPPKVILGEFNVLPLASESFDLVVAVGIYIQADTDAELRAGLTETHRVLRPSGRVFVTQWSTQTLPPDTRRVAGQRFIYAAKPGENKCRLDRDELVSVMSEAGMVLEGAIATRHSVRNGQPHEALVGAFVKR